MARVFAPHAGVVWTAGLTVNAVRGAFAKNPRPAPTLSIQSGTCGTVYDGYRSAALFAAGVEVVAKSTDGRAVVASGFNSDYLADKSAPPLDVSPLSKETIQHTLRLAVGLKRVVFDHS
jgi:hypothetical protein